MTTRRKFLTHGTLAAGASALAAPALAQGAPLKWRMQTYAGSALGEHVCKPAIDAFNKIANGQMEIELFYADQLVPTAELLAAEPALADQVARFQHWRQLDSLPATTA